MKAIEAEFSVVDIPIGVEMFVCSDTSGYARRYGKMPTACIKSGDTYFIPTPNSPLSSDELNAIIAGKRK